MRARSVVVSAITLVLLTSLLLIPSVAEGAVTLSTTRVSMDSLGAQGSLAALDEVDMTPDGRYVVFASNASNLVLGDTNSCSDVFVHDRLLRTTERVSLRHGAALQANGASERPKISDDGRYVVFESSATNLVSGDSNDRPDIFVRDRLTNSTVLVSVSTSGSLGDQPSMSPAISGNGRYVAFESRSHLTTSDTDEYYDVFVRDLVTSATTCVSVTNSGSQVEHNNCEAPDISVDGRYVVFQSDGALTEIDPDGSDVFRYDRVDGTVECVSANADYADYGNAVSAAVSATGRWIAFVSPASNHYSADDENGEYDVYLRDMSVSHSDPAAFARISGGSREDLVSGSHSPAVSPDGRYVAYVSDQPDVVDGDTNGDADVFVRDRLGATVRASVSSAGVQGTGPSDGRVGIAEFGQAVAYSSLAPELVAGDTNLVRDVFVTSALRTCTVEQDAGAVTFDRWVTGFSDSYSGGAYAYSRWEGSWIEVAFSGKQVAWVGPKQPNYGKAEVYLDGVLKTTVDCYAAAGTTTALLWTSAVLPDTTHTLRIRLTGTKNAASTGVVVVVDRFLVNSFGTGATAARFDEQGSNAAFTGTWVQSVNPTYIAKTYSYAAWAGPVYTATFFGSKVAWIGPMSQPYGKANVYIDGALKGTVDCYGAATGWRYRIWESAPLLRGQHYIQIRPLHTKRAAATNYVVVVDALDVTP